MTISPSLSTRYGRSSWTRTDPQVYARRTFSRVRSSGWAVGRIYSRRPVRVLGLRSLSSTWRSRKTWYGSRLPNSAGSFGASLRWRRTGINGLGFEGCADCPERTWPLENSKSTEGGGKPRVAWQAIEMPSFIPHCEHISGFIRGILLILMAVLL